MDNEAIVVAIASNKGGVGKTTSVMHTAMALSHYGHRVLVVDADPQATLSETLVPTTAFAIADDPDAGLAGLIRGSAPAPAVIARHPEGEGGTVSLSVDVIPANESIVAAIEIGPEAQRNALIANRLFELRPLYGFIIIDVGPTLSRLQIASLAAADLVLTPIKCDDAAFRAHQRFLRRIDEARAVNPRLFLWGILPTFYDGRHLNDRDVLDQIRTQHHSGPEIVFDPVPESTDFERAIGVREMLINRMGADRRRRAAPYMAVAEALVRHAGVREVA